MCQVDEEYNGQLEHRVTPRVSKKCVKCKENTAVLIIRAGDAFCRGCFKEYFIHKFRAMLGKNRVIFPGEKVILAVSGGPASSSMLSQGLSRDAPKKLRFVPGIIYIDEGGASGQSMEERERAVAQLESVFRATNYHYHIVHLEQVLSLPSSVLEAGSSATEKPQTGSSYKAAVDQFIQTKKNQHPDLSLENAQSHLSSLSMHEVENGVTSPITPEHTQALQKLFASVRTLTAKEDLLHTLRQHLILHTARTQGYTKVMMGDSCSRLAIKLLSNISLGRGASLATDTGFSDPRYGDVVIVRPMRDYSSKEIAYYNRMFDIPSVFIPGLDTKAQDKASIQHLTESFVTKLQTDFPSTVSTIYRTSEKLHTACPPQNTNTQPFAKCLLCVCALDTKLEEFSAYQATLISEQLSQRRGPGPGFTRGTAAAPGLPPASSASQGQCCSSGGGQHQGCMTGEGGCCSSAKEPETVDLKSLLCYSCRLTIKDMTAEDALPQYILSEAERRKRRSQMREEISEFLLDEEEDEAIPRVNGSLQ
ncbi:cytoplasmic tRNA 2-thiolation protein 2 isoform X2 [Oncorhynchus kisutch]|uniref:cytoplasmic tRNA 2-thiolation protein 2 isoform X2 n=1 Tax=Oncorhynchus kisutch TaxID=8019 RepID=UPI0012DF5265|nr:cytoplasmic tRNA 2-thiolation protein 2 isoform X2 [Oncorhynchus kisutch]